MKQETAVLAVTVLAALESQAFDPATRRQARTLIEGGTPWGRVAAFLIDSASEARTA